MSTSMATQNPEAAARLAAPVPMPTPGEVVMYHMRPGEMRAGRTSVPAFVLQSDEPNRMLKLLVFYDSNDFMTADRVPERISDNMGWTLRPDSVPAMIAKLNADIAGLRDGLDAFKDELAKVLFGEHEKPAESVEDRMQAITGRLDAIESAPSATLASIAANAKMGKANKPRKAAPGKKGSRRRG